MGTVGKVLVGIAAVVVLAIAAVVVVVLTFDPNTLIAPIQAQVKAATGRDLTVRGGARAELSLHPRVVLTEVALSNPPWAAAKDMAKAQRVEITLDLLSLLSRSLEIEKIALVGPEVNLEIDVSGQKSWEFPAAAGTSSPGGGASPTAAAGSSDVEVSNGIVTYRDGETGVVTRATIDKLSLRSRGLSSNIAVDFRGVAGDVLVALQGTLGSFEARASAAFMPQPVI